jgi:hypothetical protein
MVIKYIKRGLFVILIFNVKEGLIYGAFFFNAGHRDLHDKNFGSC